MNRGWGWIYPLHSNIKKKQADSVFRVTVFKIQDLRVLWLSLLTACHREGNRPGEKHKATTVMSLDSVKCKPSREGRQ